MVKNGENAFLLRVKGDSMIGDGIVENDLVVVKPQPIANNHEIIAAMIDGEATVKRYVKDAKGVWLHASNPRYAPIDFRREDAKIIGKIVGLVRDYTGMAF
jgi:repressor LexA